MGLCPGQDGASEFTVFGSGLGTGLKLSQSGSNQRLFRNMWFPSPLGVAKLGRGTEAMESTSVPTQFVLRKLGAEKS